MTTKRNPFRILTSHRPDPKVEEPPQTLDEQRRQETLLRWTFMQSLVQEYAFPTHVEIVFHTAAHPTQSFRSLRDLAKTLHEQMLQGSFDHLPWKYRELRVNELTNSHAGSAVVWMPSREWLAGPTTAHLPVNADTTHIYLRNVLHRTRGTVLWGTQNRGKHYASTSYWLPTNWRVYLELPDLTDPQHGRVLSLTGMNHAPKEVVDPASE